MSLFYAQALANQTVYRPNYGLTNGGNVTLEEKYRTMIVQPTDREKSGDVLKDLAAIFNERFATYNACIIGLATEIDLLRNELIGKGLLESA